MRKIFLFTAAMLAIAGCSEDNTHPKVSPVDEPSADAVTILATIDAIPSATGDVIQEPLSLHRKERAIVRKHGLPVFLIFQS